MRGWWFGLYGEASDFQLILTGSQIFVYPPLEAGIVGVCVCVGVWLCVFFCVCVSVSVLDATQL